MTIEAQRMSSMVEATTLAAIEDAVALGDRAAFAQLHDALTPRIYARLLAVADEERASTLTVAVLVEAWRRAPRLRAQQRSVSAWALAYTHALETALRPDAAS